MEDRLPTHLYIQSHLWRCSAEGVPAYVLRKGDREGGLILLKVTIPFQGSRLFTQGRDLSGRLGWVPGANGAQVDEQEATAFIERHVKRDPDLWVVEVESRDGSNPFQDQEKG
ncbi:DUF1491 family protein [Niveispirillum irakense]|uniref:DUF1491 family protein n=1 Tax=Niveispirillum irakense TaxID=34011 RepID=UPI00040F0FE2|nr:DUF1491 family protein [Niveispirillum irakense]